MPSVLAGADDRARNFTFTFTLNCHPGKTHDHRSTSPQFNSPRGHPTLFEISRLCGRLAGEDSIEMKERSNTTFCSVC